MTADEVRNIIKSRIKSLAWRFDSNKQLAELSGLTEDDFKNILKENAQSTLTLPKLYKFCKNTGFSADYLLGLSYEEMLEPDKQNKLNYETDFLTKWVIHPYFLYLPTMPSYVSYSAIKSIRTEEEYVYINYGTDEEICFHYDNDWEAETATKMLGDDIINGLLLTAKAERRKK